MKLEDAIILRIEQLCLERNMTKYELFMASGVPQSITFGKLHSNSNKKERT